MDIPKTLQQAVIFFSDPANCQDLMIVMRWPDGKVVCPRCGSENVAFLENAKLYKCYNKHEKAKFSLKVGTIFEDSSIGLDKLLMAMWLIANAKNGISSYEVHRALGITQKTAWFLLHRIRTAMVAGTIEKMSGTIEADETFIGGNAKNMHRAKRERFLPRYSSKNRVTAHKTAVFGMVKRGGKVKAQVLKSVRTEDVMPIIQENIEMNSEVFTDSAPIYRDLYAEYVHATVNHSYEYVRDNVHTNSIENFWSLLKRTIKGTYISVAPEHLQAYVEEQAFRYNEREGNDQQRFVALLESISGKRLTYAQLIGYETTH